MEQSETSATPRPLRLSIHVDKRGWRVIARRPDFRARFCCTGFDTKEAALDWCQRLGQQEQRPVSVHVTDADEEHEYHAFPYPAPPKPPVDAEAHPPRSR
jgi:hypothetical protein